MAAKPKKPTPPPFNIHTKRPPPDMTPHPHKFIGEDGDVYLRQEAVLVVDEYLRALATWQENATGNDAKSVFGHRRPKRDSYTDWKYRGPRCEDCIHFRRSEERGKKSRCDRGKFATESGDRCNLLKVKEAGEDADS
jgi:hypothetical protein